MYYLISAVMSMLLILFSIFRIKNIGNLINYLEAVALLYCDVTYVERYILSLYRPEII